MPILKMSFNNINLFLKGKTMKNTEIIPETPIETTKKLHTVIDALFELATVIDDHKNCIADEHYLIIRKKKLLMIHQLLIMPDDHLITSFENYTFQAGLPPKKWYAIGRKIVRILKSQI